MSDPLSNEEGPEEEPDELMQKLRRQKLPDVVLRAREAQAARNEYDRVLYEAKIDAHLEAHRIALDFLEESHQWVADNTDLDLVGDTRPAAAWQLAGRCIGMARLMLDALSLGYCGEVLHLARSLHEAVRLMDVLSMPEESDLLKRWLADEGNDWVRPREVRDADERFEERLAEAMKAAGVPELMRTKALTLTIYDQQSQAAHHRRRWAQDAVSPELRTMIRGRTTRWERRAGTTAAMLAVVEECVMMVGDALGRFFGPGWYQQAVKPLLTGFEAIRQAKPLT